MSADERQVGGDHYKTMDVQPWDAMESWLTPEEFRGFLKGNIIKYLARANSGKEPHDVMIGKAGHYQQKLDEVLARGKKPEEPTIRDEVETALNAEGYTSVYRNGQRTGWIKVL